MFDDVEDSLCSIEPRSFRYTPPRQTSMYIQLRFQLARFRVYRNVHLPLTFTFANLHMLIQYMFGWSDSRLHHAEVFPNVVLFDGDSEMLAGTIKSCGRKRPLEDYELGDPSAIDHWLRFVQANQPIYRVQPRVKHRKDPIDRVMLMEEKGLCLESIWSLNEAHNISDGQCSNEQIGIIYTYDFGDEWTVHITCERGNESIYRVDTPSNLPIFKRARGAPPIEHGHIDIIEDEAEDKNVSPRLYDVSYFEKYCRGEIISVSRKTCLEILTLDEEDGKRRGYLQRKKEREEERQERLANGEEDEEDEEDEFYESENDIDEEGVYD